MASWSENSSYQGAASGAAAGSVGGGVGAAAGAVIGFVAGGLIGGAQEDKAKAAESARQKAIQHAIDKQNTSDFNAKAQAEQWAMSDIGINKEDQVLDARANTAGLSNNVDKTNFAVVKEVKHQNAVKKGHFKNFQDLFDTYTNQNNVRNPNNKVSTAILNAKVAQNALAANEGILSSYDTTAAPKKY